MIKHYSLKPKGIQIINPIGYLDFLLLETEARLILTDSGGIQEEACILKVQCVTLRDNIEWPEIISIGSNVLAGANPQRILNTIDKMMSVEREWKNPYGDVKAADRIVNIVGEFLISN